MKNGIRPQLLTVIFIAVCVLISLIIRVGLPYNSIFKDGWINLASNDAYHFMRYIDILVHNFPDAPAFDPFFMYPGGNTFGGIHFFEWMVAAIAWIIGLGSPTQHTIDAVGAYIPAVLAALTIIPVFFIGKTLFNRWVGIMAAFLIAVLPGEFLGRTILGGMDHPVAEIFFSTLAVLFMILTIKAAGGKDDGQEPMTLNHLIKGDRKVITRPLVFSALAGLFLGIYLITWLGALLFVFISAIYFIIQIVVNHIKQKPSEHLGIVGFITILVALIIFLPFNSNANLTLAMIAALFVPVVMAFSSRFVFKWKLSPFYYPVILIVIAGAVFGIIYAVAPATVSTLWGYFQSVFSPGGSTAATTMEMQPFLSPQGSFSTGVAWGNFTTSFFMTESLAIPGFGLISFVILLWLYIKHRGKEENLLLFLIWTLIILIATLSQRRFAYYLAINIAVLSAYISSQIIWLGGLRRVFTETETSPGTEKIENSKVKTKKKKQNYGLPIFRVTSVLLIIVVFILVYMFNIFKSVETAKTAPYAPSDGWEESLTWMRDNTPEPLGDKEAYYKIYDSSFKYPESAYGVTAWWDYGYWITRTAHRMPSANPSQDPVAIKKVANLFISQDTATTQKAMKELDSSYVVLDFSLITSKFWAVFDWAKQDQNKYFGIYYISREGSYYPVQLMKPDFYRTLAVRLYAFDGQAVADGKPLVITYEERTSEGNIYKIVSKYEEFSSLNAAQNFIASQTSGKYDIVGVSEFISPVPLEAVPNFKLAYSSQYLQTYTQNITVPDIKIFEYVE